LDSSATCRSGKPRYLIGSTGGEEDVVLDHDALRGALIPLLDALLGKVVEPLNDEAGRRAVKHVDRGAAHPGLQLVDGERDVLRVVLVEHPDLAVRRRFGHAVSVVVEQHALVLGIAPQRHAQLLHLLHRRVEALLIAGLEGNALVAGARERERE
jgi:hypothetical protein